MTTDHFLLDTDEARELYAAVRSLPIIDYHCHLSPRDIAEDRQWETITELWLGGDHYKWRAMRAAGISERYVTGDASPWEKFEAWAHTVPLTLRNPLYHWTHMELRTAFGISETLSPQTARRIYDECNRQLRSLSARGLMRHYGVEAVCTTDDPMDDLRWHRQLRQSAFEVKVLPTWRPDRYVLSDIGIDELRERHAFFHAEGCRLADHGIGDLRREGDRLHELCVLNHERGWAQQIHFGAWRNVRSALHRTVGPDAGGDTIGDCSDLAPLGRLLDRLDERNALAPTILYNLNPAANAATAALATTFCNGEQRGKVQWGAAWWFCDHMDGITDQLRMLSAQGLLATAVGMLTDSRSFLSYPRHDYYRRLLCRLLGRDIAEGLIPASEMHTAKDLAIAVSYRNAKEYFAF